MNKYNTFGELKTKITINLSTEDQIIWHLKKNPLCLIEVDKNLQTQKIADKAVQLYSGNFLFVNDEFRTEELAMIAVQDDGSLLQDIEPEYQSVSLCKAAIEERAINYKYVSEEYRTEELKKLALTLNIAVVCHMPEVQKYWNNLFENPIYKTLIEESIKRFGKIDKLSEQELTILKAVIFIKDKGLQVIK